LENGAACYEQYASPVQLSWSKPPDGTRLRAPGAGGTAGPVPSIHVVSLSVRR